MAIPLTCSACDDIIGMEPQSITIGRALAGGRASFESTVRHVPCPGKGNHPRPRRVSVPRLFGLINRVYVTYPDTGTRSSWEEYVGPPNRFFLWLAIVFGSERYPSGNYSGVVVNGEWAWWSRKDGFCGSGVTELEKLQQAQ